jgi:putative hydrolase of the HAD superfamily
MDTVILDVGGVLLVPHAATVSTALAPLGIQLDAAQAERAHYHGVRALDEAEEDAQAERMAYLHGYCDAVGVPAEQREQALASMSKTWSGSNIALWQQIVSGTQEGLRRLAAGGRKLGIVSNSDGTVEEQLRVHQICQVGEGLGVPVLAIIDSHVVGVSKPAAEIFRHALDPLGASAEEAMYVGDTVRYDVRGARAAGLTPVHFDPYGLCEARDDHAHAISLVDVALLR